MQADLELLHARAPPAAATGQLPAPGDDPLAWRTLAVERPGAWAAAIKRLLAGMPGSAMARPDQVPLFQMDVHCGVCGAVLKNSRALHAHMCAVHHHRNPLRRKVSTLFCECCLMSFGERGRLLRHAIKCATSRRYYTYQAADIGEEACTKLDLQSAAVQSANVRAGLPPRFARERARRLQGPLPRVATSVIEVDGRPSLAFPAE